MSAREAQENYEAIMGKLADYLKNEEAEALVEILNQSSNEYKEGNHCSVDKLKEKLSAKFNKQEKQQ